MEFQEAKNKFVQAWGSLGNKWGVNRTMAQIHALLMISHQPLSAEDVMSELSISRGNANMNLRALIDWNLVYREIVPGERRDFFVAEKNTYKVAMRIIKERRKRELEPVVSLLDDFKSIDAKKDDAEVVEFKRMMEELGAFTSKADRAMDKLTRTEESWFFGTLLKLFR
ncbi:MAG: transcriptional regulator [Bacteroidetes bacterium]|nr:transcriptional regulator [Bacteroidota bacterium]